MHESIHRLINQSIPFYFCFRTTKGQTNRKVVGGEMGIFQLTLSFSFHWLCNFLCGGRGGGGGRRGEARLKSSA